MPQVYRPATMSSPTTPQPPGQWSSICLAGGTLAISMARSIKKASVAICHEKGNAAIAGKNPASSSQTSFRLSFSPSMRSPLWCNHIDTAANTMQKMMYVCSGMARWHFNQKSGTPTTATVTVPDAGRWPSGPIEPTKSRAFWRSVLCSVMFVYLAVTCRIGNPQYKKCSKC